MCVCMRRKKGRIFTAEEVPLEKKGDKSRASFGGSLEITEFVLEGARGCFCKGFGKRQLCVLHSYLFIFLACLPVWRLCVWGASFARRCLATQLSEDGRRERNNALMEGCERGGLHADGQTDHLSTIAQKH